MTGGGCGLQQLCGLGNVCCSVGALALSAFGALTSSWSVGGFALALRGLGGGAEILDEAVGGVSLVATALVIVNFLCTALICMSTFECGSSTSAWTKNRVVLCLTSSRCMCFWQLTIWISFLVQMVLTQLILVAVVMLSSLIYICDMGAGVQDQLQGLVSYMGNSSASEYNMYGWMDSPDTPVVSMRDLIADFNVKRFCWSSEDLGHRAIAFYLGCLLVSVAQAVMASSLHGERERVTVHENHEQDLAVRTCSSPKQPWYPYVAAHEGPPQSRFASRSEDFSMAMLAAAEPRYNMDFRESSGKVELF